MAICARLGEFTCRDSLLPNRWLEVMVIAHRMGKLWLEILQLLVSIAVKQPVKGFLVISSINSLVFSPHMCRFRLIDLLFRGELQHQFLLTEHMPHGPKLSEELWINILTLYRIITKSFACLRELTRQVTEIVQIAVLLY